MPDRTKRQWRTAPIKKTSSLSFSLPLVRLSHAMPLGAVAVCRGPSKGWPDRSGEGWSRKRKGEESVVERERGSEGGEEGREGGRKEWRECGASGVGQERV